MERILPSQSLERRVVGQLRIQDRSPWAGRVFVAFLDAFFSDVGGKADGGAVKNMILSDSSSWVPCVSLWFQALPCDGLIMEQVPRLLSLWKTFPNKSHN